MEKAVGLIILAIGIMAGCTVKESAELTETHLVFTTSREYVAPDTRSVRQEDGSVWWGPKEEISMFYGSGTNGGSKFTSTNSALAETVDFEGSISISGSKEFWAVYPYSTDNSCDGSSITTVISNQQTGVEGNFSNDAFPAMAKASSMSLPFWNICGGIKISVSRSDIKSVTIKGNNGEALAGKVKVAFNAEGHPEVTEVIDGQVEVTLKAPYGSCFMPGRYYYFTLLPTALDAGITLTFTTVTDTGILTSDKAQTIKRSIFGVLKNVDSRVSNWEQHQIPTILDFAQEYVKILDIWGKTTGEVVMHPDVPEETVANAHYVPSTTTFTLGGKTYNTADMWETALRSYLLLRGYDGLETEEYGKNSIPALEGGAVSMTTTEAPPTHDYFWGKAPFNETMGNGGHLVMGTVADNVHCQVKTDILDNWAMRSLNFQHGQPITNLCGYAGGQLDGYYGCFCSQRALITYAFFFKYMLDNGLDKGTDVDDNTIIRSELFGYETEFVPAAVDLGLPSGIKWASFNAGASKPWEYGDYFAWGETEPKDDYSWVTYKWCNGADGSFTKYCPSTHEVYWGGSGLPDNKTVLYPEDDAARVILGGGWRMPTDEDWTELRDNCKWTWLRNYNGTGISGNVVSKNGNSIFLPAAGCRNDTGLDNVESYGYYWSSSLMPDDPSFAWYVNFYSGGVRRHGSRRYSGLPIRPVCSKE